MLILQRGSPLCNLSWWKLASSFLLASFSLCCASGLFHPSLLYPPPGHRYAFAPLHFINAVNPLVTSLAALSEASTWPLIKVMRSSDHFSRSGQLLKVKALIRGVVKYTAVHILVEQSRPVK